MTMQGQFGLNYEITQMTSSINATGVKSRYYSLNTCAAEFGYQPSLTSLEGVIQEATAILKGLAVRN